MISHEFIIRFRISCIFYDFKRFRISGWMVTNGYRQTLMDCVAKGSCPPHLLARFKAERKSVNGANNDLNQAQKSFIFGNKKHGDGPKTVGDLGLRTLQRVVSELKADLVAALATKPTAG